MNTHTINPHTIATRSKRAKRLDARNFTRTHCAANLTRGVPCGTPLHSRFVDGQTVPFCPQCDRKRRGVCVRCTTERVAGTVGLAIYCVACKRLANAEAMARHRVAHADDRKARDDARRADPAKRTDRAEYNRLYRLSRPRKVRELAHVDYTRHRDTRLAYFAAYRAEKREQLNAARRRRYHGDLPERACVSCPMVLTGRAKRCGPCVQAIRTAARAAIAARLADGPASDNPCVFGTHDA